MAFNLFGGKKTENTLTVINPNKELFDSIMGTLHCVGNKMFGYIPLSLLFQDTRYQRKEYVDVKKIERLAAKWDDNKMDPICVSVHRETCNFAVLEGGHRLEALLMIGATHAVCTVLDLGEEPDRLQKEIDIFLEQNRLRDPMRPIHMLPAQCSAGKREYIDLKDVVENTKGVRFKTPKDTGRGVYGSLTGFQEALSTCKTYGKDVIQDVYDIIIGAGWNMQAQGFSDASIRMIKSVLITHGKETKPEITRILREYSPKLFLAKGIAYYEKSERKAAQAMYLEDFVCSNLGIRRLIDDGKEQKRFTPDVA